MAFFGVNFILQKFCPCKKNDKLEVWSRLSSFSSLSKIHDKKIIIIYSPKLFLFWHYLVLEKRATLFVLLSALHHSQTQTDEIGDMAENMWISIAFMSEKALQSTLIGCLRKKNCLNWNALRKLFKWNFLSTQLVVVFKLTQNCELSQTCKMLNYLALWNESLSLITSYKM